MKRIVSIWIILLLVISGIQLFFPSKIIDISKASPVIDINLYPNDNGTYTQWTVNGATYNYQAVYEVVPDNLATYVSSSTVGQKDTYALENVPLIYRNDPTVGVTNVAIAGAIGGSDWGPRFDVISYNGTSLQTVTADGPIDPSWGSIWTDIPVPSGGWTWDAVDNLEVGIRYYAGSDFIYLTNIYIDVTIRHIANQTAVYVDDDFTAATPGWNNYTFDNIFDAYDNLMSSGTMYIWNGSYMMDSGLTIGKKLSVRGNDSSSVIFSMDGGQFNIHTIDGCSFSNITFVGTPAGSSSSVFNLENTKYTNITYCKFTQFKPFDDGMGGFYGSSLIESYNDTEANIKHCVFNDSNVTFIEFMGSSACEIIGNVFENDTPIDDAALYLNGIQVLGNSNNIFYFNDFINITDGLGTDVSCFDDSLDNHTEWDDGALGNYYSAYDESSEGAWDNNSNGIIDSPFHIPGAAGALDYYPSTVPFGGVLPGTPPLITNEKPTDASIGVNISLNTVNVTIIQTDSDLFDWKIGGDNITTNSSTGDTTGIKRANINGPLVNLAVIDWWVNVSDVDGFVNESYSFTVESYPATTLYVDDDFTVLTPGWHITKYDSIVDAVAAVNLGGIVYVYPGQYNEVAVLNKTMSLIGFAGPYGIARDSIIVNGTGSGNVITVTGNKVNISFLRIQNGDYGIYLDSVNNGSIVGCNMTHNNQAGLYFSYSNDTLVKDNNFTDNTGAGLDITDPMDGSGSFNNIIYHNNFIANSVNAVGELIQIWNTSYPFGGNYWDDHYWPFDNYSGPAQNYTGSDGIYDQEHDISRVTDDFLPLSSPWHLANHAPYIWNPNPIDGQTTVSVNQSNVRITIQDMENNLLTWSVESKYITAVHITGTTGGVKTVALNLPLPYYTIITWYVNATDGTSWTRKVFTFKTARRFVGTIQDAINASQIGGTIIIYAGEYNEELIINKALTLIGEGSNNTTINGTGTDDVILIKADDVVVKDFTIKGSGTNSTPGYDSGIEVRGDNVELIGNNITGNNYGIYINGAEDSSIIMNYIDANMKDGIKIDGGTNTVIQNNSIGTNGNDGINASNCDSIVISYDGVFSNNASGIDLLSNTTLTEIHNNNISGNNINGIKISSGASYNDIRRNNISSQSCGVFIDPAAISDCEKNLVYNNNFYGNMEQAKDNGVDQTFNYYFDQRSNVLNWTINPDLLNDTSENTYAGENYIPTNFTLIDNITTIHNPFYGAYGIWGDGDYLYVADWENGIEAYEFNTSNSSFTLKGAKDDGDGTFQYADVWGDGNYVYAACRSGGLRAYYYLNGTFTLLDTINTAASDYYRVWGHGAFIYTACIDKGIRAYLFNGTSFTYLNSIDNGGDYSDVWGDGTYIYTACYDSGIRAYTFNGAAFTLKATKDDGNAYQAVWGDGTYIYAGCGNEGLRAYRFNGTAFTLLDTLYDGSGSYYYAISGYGNDIFVIGYDPAVLETKDLISFTFDGTDLTITGEYNQSKYYLDLWVNSSYIFTACWNELRAFKFGSDLFQTYIQLLTDHTGNIAATPHGTVVSVLARIKTNLSVYCEGTIYLRPYWDGTDGSLYDTYAAFGMAGSWSNWFNIIGDINGGNCNWDDIKQLQMEVIATIRNGSAYASMVELQVIATMYNHWNESYPVGGNFYDDFHEQSQGAYDHYTGPLQNILGADGIVDENSPNPYFIPGLAGSEDFYPLVYPIGTIFGPTIPPTGGGGYPTGSNGSVSIPPVQPPKYPNNPFTVPEMYQLIRANVKSDAKIIIVVIDSGIVPQTYKGVDMSHIVCMQDRVYSSGRDGFGHGTWVNYCIRYGIQAFCPNVVQYSIRAFDDSGRCSPKTFLDSLEMAKSLHPDIVTISAGSLGNANDAFSKKVSELRDAGIFVVVSAGNNGPKSSSITSPACSADAIAVGAIDPIQRNGIKTILDLSDDVVCSFSSRGPVEGISPKPDFTCPGESIIGPWGGGERIVSGTSMAAPFLAASAIQVISADKPLLDVVKLIYGSKTYLNIVESSIADSAYKKGNQNDYGWGIPNVQMAVTIAWFKALFAIIIFIAAILAIIITFYAIIRIGKKKDRY